MAASLVAVGCHDGPGARAPAAGPADLAARWGDCMQHLERGEWPVARRDCLAERFVGREVDVTGALDGRALVAQLDALRAAFPDLRVAPQLVLVADRRVFAVAQVEGTQQGVLHGPRGDIGPAGKRIGVTAVFDVEFDATGHAVEASVYLDRIAILGQLAALPEGFDPPRPALAHLDAPPLVASQAGDAKERANAAVVRTFTDAVNAHRTADVLAVVGDDIVDSDAGLSADLSGGAVRQMYTRLLHDVADYHREVPAVFAIGDYVIAPGVKTGTWDTSKVKLHYIEVLRLDRGKIVENRRIYDGLAMVDQIIAGAH